MASKLDLYHSGLRKSGSAESAGQSLQTGSGSFTWSLGLMKYVSALHRRFSAWLSPDGLSRLTTFEGPEAGRVEGAGRFVLLGITDELATAFLAETCPEIASVRFGAIGSVSEKLGRNRSRGVIRDVENDKKNQIIKARRKWVVGR